MVDTDIYNGRGYITAINYFMYIYMTDTYFKNRYQRKIRTFFTPLRIKNVMLKLKFLCKTIV